MGKLVYIANISLDGYIADRDGRIDFSVPSLDVFTAILDIVRPAGTYLYGRRMYEAMSVWDTAHVAPGSPAFIPGLREVEGEFATLWRAADKVVFSRSLASAATSRTRVEREIGVIAQIKAASTRDVTIGGAELAAAAFGLVDELHAFVCPVILGGGNAWLRPGARTNLALVGERRLGNVVHVHYRACR